MAELLYLEAKCRNAAGAMRINDLPMLSFEGAPLQAYIPAAPNLVRGGNRIEVRAHATAPDASMMLRIAIFDDGDEFFAGKGREIFRIEQAPTLQPIVRDFNCPIGPNHWIWQTCRVWANLAQAAAAAAPYIDKMTAAWRARDVGWFLEAAKPKHIDMAMALPTQTLETIEVAVSAAIADQIADPNQVFPPLAPVLCGDGRVLQLLANDGIDFLRGRDSDGKFNWPVTIGQVPTGWAIVR